MSPLDPSVQSDLDALDAALRGDPDADPLLRLLADDVRADAPGLRLAARTELAERVANGFTRPPRRRRWLGARVLLPAAGALASLLLVVALVGPQIGPDEPQPRAVGGSVTSQAGGGAGGSSAEIAPSALDQAGPDGGAARAVPAPPSAGLAPERARRVQRTGSLELRTRPGKLQATADGVVREALALGAIVVSSQVERTQGGGTASFQLAVPASRLQEAIARLSDLASVAAVRQGSEDVTGAFVSAEDRLQDARDEREALLGALRRASSEAQVDGLRRRLAAARRAVARREAEVRRLKARTDRAQLTVLLTGDVPAEDDGAGTWSPGDAARDALRVLEVAAGVLLVTAAALMPLALLGAAGAGLLSVRRRRRREAALGA